MLAAASDAVILAFNVRPVGDARSLAEREGIEIRGYSVIYRAIDELRAAMQGMLEPDEVEETVGQVEVRQTFRASRIGTIAGCFVTEGKVTRGAKVRVVRDGTVINETTVASLKRFNEDAREVSAGFECGIVLANFQDVKEGDVLEVYETRKVKRAHLEEDVPPPQHLGRRSGPNEDLLAPELLEPEAPVLVAHGRLPAVERARHVDLLIGAAHAAVSPNGKRKGKGRRVLEEVPQGLGRGQVRGPLEFRHLDGAREGERGRRRRLPVPIEFDDPGGQGVEPCAYESGCGRHTGKSLSS